MTKRLLAAVFIGVLVPLGVIWSAGAVEYGGIGGRPANPRTDNPRTQSIFIFDVKPGTTKSDAIKVYNNTDEPKSIGLDAVDSILSSGGAFACAQNIEPKKDVGKWITLSTKTVELEPHTSVAVPFNLTAPKNADVGEHDGCITLQDAAATKKTTKNSGITLTFRSAIRVVATIPGKIIKKVSLTSVNISSGKDRKVIVTPTARNDGNTSLDLKVDASIKSLLGNSLASSSSSYPILPRSSASWNFELSRPFWGGLYYASSTISYSTSTTAELGQESGPRKSISKRSGLFLSPPAPLAAFVELVILFAVIYATIFFTRKRKHRHEVKTAWVEYNVGKDESITEIANKHNIAWKKLASANNLKAPYTIKPGVILRVPAAIEVKASTTKPVPTSENIDKPKTPKVSTKGSGDTKPKEEPETKTPSKPIKDNKLASAKQNTKTKTPRKKAKSKVPAKGASKSPTSARTSPKSTTTRKSATKTKPKKKTSKPSKSGSAKKTKTNKP